MKITKQSWEELPYEQRMKMLKVIKTDDLAKRAAERAMVADARRRGALKADQEKNQQNPQVLKARARMAWRKAQSFNPVAEYVDYELIMVKRSDNCPECGKLMGNEKELAIAHRVPLNRHGEHHEHNLKVLHISCHKKAVGRLRQFRAQMEKAGSKIDAETSKEAWKAWSRKHEEKTKLKNKELKIINGTTFEEKLATLRAQKKEEPLIIPDSQPKPSNSWADYLKNRKPAE